MAKKGGAILLVYTDLIDEKLPSCLVRYAF